MRSLTPAAVSSLALAVAAGAAEPANPSFEVWVGGACNGWSGVGVIASSTGAPVTPTHGAACALLTSGNVPAADVAAFCGATLTAINGEFIDDPARDGTAIKQVVTVEPGEVIAFDFRFNNGETANNTEWPDSAFVIVNGAVTRLATSANLPQGWTAVETRFIMTPPTGSVELAFAVFNFADFAVDSQLMVDNVRVGQGVGPCGPADMGKQGGVFGPDGRLDNNDFVSFIDAFFLQSPAADKGVQGGVAGSDGVYDNNDFVVFVDQFFAVRGVGGCNG